MVEPNGVGALDRCADCGLEVFWEGGSLMRLLVVSLSLFVFIGGCASLKNKCVNVEIKNGGRADIVLGMYASTYIYGPGSWRSAPRGLQPGDCQVVFGNRDLAPIPSKE